MCIFGDIPVAQLGQNHLQRLAEAFQYANTIFQTHNALRLRQRRRIVRSRRKCSLRILRVHQKGRPSVDPAGSGLEQAHALVCRIPAFHHDVVQLIAQKLIHHRLILLADFQEIGKCADRF